MCPRAAPRSPAARKLPQCSAGVPVPLHSLARRRRAAEARAGEPGGRGCNPSARPRGAPPRRSSRALSPRPGEGAEPPGCPARPGPAPGPAPSPEAPAAGVSRPPTRPPALVRRPAQRPPRCSSPSLARTSAHPQRGGGAGDGCCPRAHAPGTPEGGVHTHLAGRGGARRGRAAGSGPPAAAGRVPGERRLGSAGTGTGQPPGSGRRRVPSAAESPAAGRPAGAAQLRN